MSTYTHEQNRSSSFLSLGHNHDIPPNKLNKREPMSYCLGGNIGKHIASSCILIPFYFFEEPSKWNC